MRGDRQSIQREELALVKQFVDGPVWAWLKQRLERRHMELTAQIGALPSKLSPEDRLILTGKMSMVAEILTRPEALMLTGEQTAPAPVEHAPKHRPPRAIPSVV